MTPRRSGRELSGLTSPEAARLTAAGALLAVPVGSTEQHGPHLPLSTDTDVAVELCARLSTACEDVVVAPAVSYGASGEHEGFAGTLSIGQEALETLLVELCRSAVGTFAGVVLVSTHGGNAGPATRAQRRMVQESRPVLLWCPTWTGDAHAGRTETSLELALAPDLVRLDRAEAGERRPLADLMPALRAGGVAAVSANGVLGDPIGASAAEGAALLEVLATDLVRSVETWRADRAAGWRDASSAAAAVLSPGGAA